MTPLVKALILVFIFVLVMGLIIWYARKESKVLKGGKKK